MGADLKFAVIHVGARLHYAVPAALEKAGALRVLYTDAHAGSPASAFLRPFGSLPGGRGIRRLISRRIPVPIPPSKVRSWVWPSLQKVWLNCFHSRRRKEARFWYSHQVGGHWLARKVIADNFGGANALYVHPCASTGAVREAKRRGLLVVLEAISHPFNKFVERAEYERFGLSAPQPDPQLSDNLTFFKEEALLADLVLAASPYVRDGLLELGLDPRRVTVVPYGLDPGFFDKAPAPQPGRVLYVGNISYLKGVPYLAEAARQLRAQGFASEIRAVGPRAKKLVQRPEFAGLDYIGQVPRADVKREFLSADIFLFPTLSDGFGVVLLEALFAGLPIICTPNCGDVVRDGFNGRLVPTHDATAIASAVREITSDRARREKMSHNVLSLTGEFTWEAYQRRLVAALGRVVRSVDQCLTAAQLG